MAVGLSTIVARLSVISSARIFPAARPQLWSRRARHGSSLRFVAQQSLKSARPNWRGIEARLTTVERRTGSSSSKYEISKVMATHLASAHFEGDGADWFRTQGGVRWELFLSVDRVDAGAEFDVAFRAVSLAWRAGTEDEVLVASSLSQVARRSRLYKSVEMLTFDLDRTLLPTIEAHPDAEAVIAGYLDGHWDQPGTGRATSLGGAWQSADRLGLNALAEKVYDEIRSERWSSDDLSLLEWYGVSAGELSRKPRWFAR